MIKSFCPEIRINLLNNFTINLPPKFRPFKNFGNMYVTQTPTCGCPPQYQGVSPPILQSIHQFDWNYLNSLNTEFIRESRDYNTLEKFAYMFADSDYTAVDQQFLPFPLSKKFFEITHDSVKLLFRRIRELQNRIKEQDKEIKYMRHKFEKATKKIDNLSLKQNPFPPPPVAYSSTKEAAIVVHSCPCCGRAFRSIQYLDKHVIKEHRHICEAWLAIREGKPYGTTHELKSLKNDVEDLRACLTRQNIASSKMGLEDSTINIRPSKKSKSKKKRKSSSSSFTSSSDDSKSHTKEKKKDKSDKKSGKFTSSVEIKPKALTEIIVTPEDNELLDQSSGFVDDDHSFPSFSSEPSLSDDK